MKTDLKLEILTDTKAVRENSFSRWCLGAPGFGFMLKLFTILSSKLLLSVVERGFIVTGQSYWC